jgi:tetratricopeptide (TPR) repeat protein
MKRAFALVLFVSAAAGAQDHAAGVWERAASPERAIADRVHKEVEALLLVAYAQHSEDSGVAQEKLSNAMERLEQVHADRSSDVRLRFDYGQVAKARHDYARAAAALESALHEAPDHPRAATAYFDLGVCLATLSKTEAEIAAYDESLKRETDPQLRTVALSNRGEAYMVLSRQPQMTLSHLARAADDFRAALVLDAGYPQAHWSLAVALDRTGDLPGAMVQAKLAVDLDPLERQISGPGVFFVPPYDQYWYEALSAMARTQQPQQVDDAASTILLWETAVAKWQAYAAVAPSDDRWLPLAKAHLTSSQRMLEQAKKKSAREAKKHRVHDELVDP